MRRENPRMCLLTGRRLPKDALLRFEEKEGRLLLSPEGEGRGIYLSPEGLRSPKARKALEGRLRRKLSEEEWKEALSHGGKDR